MGIIFSQSNEFGVVVGSDSTIDNISRVFSKPIYLSDFSGFFSIWSNEESLYRTNLFEEIFSASTKKINIKVFYKSIIPFLNKNKSKIIIHFAGVNGKGENIHWHISNVDLEINLKYKKRELRMSKDNFSKGTFLHNGDILPYVLGVKILINLDNELQLLKVFKKPTKLNDWGNKLLQSTEFVKRYFGETKGLMVKDVLKNKIGRKIKVFIINKKGECFEIFKNNKIKEIKTRI